MKIAIFDSAWYYDVSTPYEKPLGGTQSSICYFIEEMKTRGNDIYFFNKRDKIDKIKDILHIPANTYLNYINENKLALDLIIVSCLPHEIFQIKNTINNPNILYAFWTGHDIDQNASKILKDTKAVDMIDLFIFVSDWQRNRYIEHYNIK